MAQPDPTLLRDELLRQASTGNDAVDAGLARLRQIVEEDQARVRRLTRWTKIVWIGVAALLILALLLPFVIYLLAAASPTTAPRPAVQVMAPVAATLFLVGVPTLLVCIIVGIILLIMTILAGRTAGMQEMRAQVASIDAQLRLLAAMNASEQDVEK